MSFVARLVSAFVEEGGEVRFIALDIHRDFCEVAIAEGGAVRWAPRVKTDPETLELFAASLGADDQVTLETTGNALAVARIIEPHVAASCSLIRERPREREQRAQDGQGRRTHARAAARGWIGAGGVTPGRADAAATPARVAAGAVGAAADAGEESGARSADPQPATASADARPFRHRRQALAHRADAADRRAGDGRELLARDRLPRRRDRAARAGDGARSARRRADAAATRAARNQRRRRLHAARSDRRLLALPRRRPPRRLRRAQPACPPVRFGQQAPKSVSTPLLLVMHEFSVDHTAAGHKRGTARVLTDHFH